jgi:hypothetical protein
MAFALSLVRVGAVLLAASAVGWAVAGALFPLGPRHREERLGWSYALGCGVLAAFVPLSFLVGARPTWIAFLVFAGLLLAARLVPAPLTLPAGRSLGESRSSIAAGPPRGEGRLFQALLWSLIVLGIVLYALRALTEPMWANDFIAIWGLKGKTIFGAAGFPERLTGLEFAHPEYPLGLPLLYAGIAFLMGRWDDHAMALVFPLLQVATLAVLVGWLRRRGVSSTVAYLATAIVACFEPLYSAFLTGMAEVPLSFGVLLFGTALADALEGTDAGALRRLAFAAALIAAMKNEGLFLAAAGSLLALIFGKGARWKVALAALGPAILVRALHFPWRSRLPLADFEWGLFSIERVWDSLAAAAVLLGWATWAGLALLLVFIALGGRVPAGDRLLLLAACAVAAYLVIPAFAVRGPAWLIETTLLRTTAALVPLAASGLAVRFPER